LRSTSLRKPRSIRERPTFSETLSHEKPKNRLDPITMKASSSRVLPA